MCDSIANGGPRAVAEKCCPPANVIIASNVLNTTGNVIAGNIISVDGTFTGNLYVSGNIISNISYSVLNVTGSINGSSIWGTNFYGNGSGLSSLNASNLTGTISNTNLPPSGVVAGTYGSSVNVSRITVDQYGIVTGASNVPTQWTTVAGNVAYQNGVSIGTLSAPPVGSNLYVLGSANITDTLYVSSAVVYGSSTLNVFGISNLNSVLASLYSGNGSGLSNLNSSNLVGNVAAANVAMSVTNPAQPNITSLGTLNSLTVNGLLIASNGSGISNLNSSNLVGNVAAANVASSVTNPAQPNITSLGTLNSLTVNGLLIASNGSGISNLNSSNLIGNVAAANVAMSVTNPAQPNITSLGILNSLTVNGLLVASNGSAISNINGANVSTVGTAQSVTNASQPNITSVGTLTGLYSSGNVSASLFIGGGNTLSNVQVANLTGTVNFANTAGSVTNAAQPNITSVGTLTSLSVTGTVTAGTFVGDGQGLFGIHASAITETVATANSVVQPAQPNITSVGTLTGLTVNGLLIVSNGSGISNINSSNLIGNVANASVALVVSQPAQPNITSLGTLTSLNVSGISNLNSTVSGLISGNGSGISNINSSNLTGTISTGNFPTSGVTAGLYGSGANVSSVTVDQYGRVTNASNIAITASQWTSAIGNTIYYTNAVGIGATTVPSATLMVTGNAYVSNSVTTTNIFFNNTIQATNLPTSGVAAGGYGSSVNVAQITVDQYGRVTSASNVSVSGGGGSSQWTTVDGNVAYQNGVSIGTLSNPPAGSNLYVLGTANIDTINTSSLFVATANITTNNVSTLVVRTQANLVSANVTTGNIATANITTENVVTSNITTANVTNLRVQTLANLVSANVTTGNIATANLTTANIVTANVTTANVTNLRVQTLANLVSANVTTGNIATANIINENVTTLNVTSDLTVSGALTSNSANTTFYFDTLVIPYMNVTTTANISALNVIGTTNLTTLNGLTANFTSIFSTNSNLVNANIGTENVLTLNGLSIFSTNSNLVNANIGTENVVTLNGFSIFTQNSNLVNANIGTENVLTLNGFSIFATNSNLVNANVGTENVVTLNGFSIFATNSNLVNANIGTENVLTLNGVSIFGTNLNVGAVSNLTNLVVTSNILAGPSGNTYITGNLVVSGNVFSNLGMPLGSGGGYYFSLASDIALQTPYTGALYGTTYPLSVGLSNGFSISGTSTLITVTANGNFSFNTAGPYLLRGVFNSSDNITGLAVGSNVADRHGTDQGYLYRYTTFITQNPTELIEIPFNVTDTTKYYYLDLFSTDGGTLRQTANTSGGTFLTITPLQGGGLATGGPGGTPGTQWISSGSNIYYSNSVGIGAINPAYNLDVGTGTTNTAVLRTTDIYGAAANVNIRSNLYVSGNSVVASYASYGNMSGFRNRIINGRFNIDYRANTVTVSNTVPANSNAWIVDRMRARAGNLTTSNASVTIRQLVPPTGLNFGHALRIDVNRIASNVAGNPWFVPLCHTVEGFVGLPFYFGSAQQSRPLVLAFSSNTNIASSITVGVVLKSVADNTYYATTTTISNTLGRNNIIPIPRCTVGTWNQRDLPMLEVLIGGVSLGPSPVGQVATANLNTWQTGSAFNPYTVQGVSSWLTSTGGWIEIVGLQLEVGTVATPLEIASPVTEITACARYYEINFQTQYQVMLPSGRANTIAYSIQKRNNANVLVYVDASNLYAGTNASQFISLTGSGSTTTTPILSYLESEYGFSYTFTQNNGGFNTCISEGQFVWTADAEFYP